jgi:tetratricopeptide (TPR) repeat protein
VQLEYHGNILYRRTLSDTNYSDYADYDDIAVEVVRDLVPRTVRYSVRIKPQEGNTILEQAVQACQQGDWNTGSALAEASLQTYPNDAEAYYLLGIIERNNRNFAASDAHFNRAYAIAPSSRYTSAIRENNVIKQKEDLAISQLNG